MKEKAATFSFDNPKMPSRAIDMILLKCEKINPQMKICIENYEKMMNYGALTCPFCNSRNIIRWGTYERNAIFFNEQENLESKIVKIQRVKCKSCGHTHALLPFGIIPYKQFVSEVITKVLRENTIDSIINIASKYEINENIIKKWIYSFKEKHLSRLKTQLINQKLEKMLEIIDENLKEKEEYLRRNNRCFMQIKLGVLGLSPS